MTVPKSPETPDPKADPRAAAATPAAKKEPIGTPADLVLLDEHDQPVDAVSRDDLGLDEKAKPPFRISHPETDRTYERVGNDEDGRPTYRPS